MTNRELLTKTSATPDGHEALVPDFCPSLPPLLYKGGSVETSRSSVDEEFPVVRSPLLMRARKVSSDVTPSNNTPQGNMEYIGPSLPPNWQRSEPETVQPTAQKGHHYHQMASKTESFDAQLFGVPPEETTVFVSNLPSHLTQRERLIQDFSQRDELPVIKDVRIPLVDETRNKGFCYLDFETVSDAVLAAGLLDGLKLDGMAVKAQLSQPTKEVYEATVLYVPDLDASATADDIKTFLEEAHTKFLNDYPQKRSLSCGESSVKRSRLDEQAAESVSESGSDEEKPVVSPDWTVVGVRVIEPKDTGSQRHAYVEFTQRGAVLDVLKWQQYQTDKKQQLRFRFTPSIPKKRAMRKESAKATDRLQRTVRVSNLPPGMNEDKITAMVREYGEVARIVVTKDAEGRTNGWALVEYRSSVGSSAALSMLSGQTRGGRTVRVTPSKSRITQRKPGGRKGVPDKSTGKPAARPAAPGGRRETREPPPDSGANAAAPRPVFSSNADFKQALGL